MTSSNLRAIGCLVSLLACACGTETTTYSAALEDGSGGTESAGLSAQTGTASSSVTAGGNGSVGAGGTSQVPSTSAGDGKFCVPGQSVACACSDGASSAQVCAADGQSFGACDCGPAEVVVPAGYSGECVLVGLSDVCYIDSVRRYTFVNCEASPSPDEFQCIKSVPAINGVFCCYARDY
jgi:hypothetical protein